MELLTTKQKKFVEGYLTSFNAQQAALDAGYSPNGVDVQASRLLRNEKVKKEINIRIEELNEKTADKRAYLIKFWEKVINDPETLVSAKLRASDMLAKYLGMYGNTMEVTGSSDKPIKVVWGE